MTMQAHDPTPETAAEAVAFGFGSSDEAWLARVRDALALPAGLALGEFELLGEVRRGGQGLVVRARQPRTGRAIALKRLAHGAWATPAERFRFEREVEAVVSLNHPNIVAVHGIEVADGQPLLAMEWVDGEPIDRWAQRPDADGRPRATAAVLGAFLKVCDAVHHAHQRGVLHRDLKPANILVAGDEPKVLDFGLARPLDSGAASGPSQSGFVGTPGYAAPEQLDRAREPADVRTDIYALGVVLYELLAGRPPFAVDAGLARLFDAIRAGSAAPPSRFSGRADADLDAVTLKAMAAEPARRYSSVDGLAGDLRRCLAGEPVEARRGQRGYVASKLLRRFRVPIAVTGAFVLTITAASAALWVSYARQGRMLQQVKAARDDEAAARRSAERTLAALDTLLLQVAEVGRGPDATLRRQMLQQAERQLEAQLGDAPPLHAAALETLGRTYGQLALYDDGERCLRAALALRIAFDGPQSLPAAAAMDALGELLQTRSHGRQAEPLIREALELRRAALGDDHPAVAESLLNLAAVRSNEQRFDEALRWSEQALDILRGHFGPQHVDSVRALTARAYAHMNLGQYEPAEHCLREALALTAAREGPSHRVCAALHVGLSKVALACGELESAEEHLRAGLAMFREVLGDRHDDTAWAAHRLGVVLHLGGRVEEAERLQREARETYIAVLGPDSPFVGFVDETLADLLDETGRADEAAGLRVEAAELRADRAGADSAGH